MLENFITKGIAYYRKTIFLQIYFFKFKIFYLQVFNPIGCAIDEVTYFILKA